MHRRKCCARSPRPIVAEAWIPRGIVGALPLVLDGGILRALRSDHAPSFDFSGTPAGLDAIGRDVAHAVVAIEDSSLLMTLAWHGLG